MPLETKNPFQGIAKEQADDDALTQKGCDESQGDEELDHHQPTGLQFLPDQSVLITVKRVTTVKQFIKLVVGVPEFVEAKLPKAHVFKRALRVFP